LWVENVRAASFLVRYEVFDADRLCARAATLLVPFDFGTDRPRRLTGTEREVLAGFGDDGHAR
jgi:acyl-CoA thioester hydrolase